MPANPLPSPAVSGARPGADDADLAAVWSVLTGMYAAYTAGDRDRIDSFLDPAATVWDSETPGLLCGKADLDAVREARPAPGEGPVETGLEAYGPVVDVFADLAVVRYWLRVDFAPAADGPPLRPELVRNTALLRRTAAGWLIVHLHEDRQQVGGLPID